MSIASVLSSRLYRLWLNYTAGTWTCTQSSGNATQATAALQPTANNVGTPSQSYPDFDGAGTNADYLTASALSSLPTYNSATQSFLWGAAVRWDANPAGLGVLVSVGAAGGLNTDCIYHSTGSGRLTVGNTVAAVSNADVLGLGWLRLIVHKNASSGVLTLYINGVAQTTTGTDNFGQFWKTDGPTIGDQDGILGRKFDGGAAAMFWAMDTSPFSGTDISNLDAELLSIISDPVFFLGSGAVNAGTLSTSAAYPTGLAAGDRLILFVGNKYPTNGPSTPTGFSTITNGQGSGGAGTAGADSGSTYCTAFERISDGTETGSVTVSVPSAVGVIVRMFAYRAKSGYTFQTTTAANGGDNSAGTAVSATMGTDPGITAGDVVVAGFCSNTDARTYASEAVSATGISAWGTVTERNDSGTTQGDDMALVVSEHPVVTGTSSAAPVYTCTASGTTANQVAGGVVLVRLRATAGGTNYTLTAANGSFTLSGQATGLAAQRKLAAAQGSFTLSGQATGLAAQRRLASAQGSFTFTGEPVGLAAQRRLAAGQGSFTFTGEPVTLTYTPVSGGGAHSLVASTGNFALTGQAVVLKAARVFALGTGNFALSGQSTGLAAQRRLTAAQGSFAFTGQAAALKAARVLGVGVGSFALTGRTAGLAAQRRLAAGQGSFALAGQAVALRLGHALLAGQGAFALTGQAASFSRTRKLTAATGLFVLSGGDVLFLQTGQPVVIGHDVLVVGETLVDALGGEVVLVFVDADEVAGVKSAYSEALTVTRTNIDSLS